MHWAAEKGQTRVIEFLLATSAANAARAGLHRVALAAVEDRGDAERRCATAHAPFPARGIVIERPRPVGARGAAKRRVEPGRCSPRAGSTEIDRA